MTSLIGSRRKVGRWMPRYGGCTLVATMLVLMGCSTRPREVRFIESGYLTLQKGQVFTAPAEMTLAEMWVVHRKNQQIAELLAALRSQQAMKEMAHDTEP